MNALNMVNSSFRSIRGRLVTIGVVTFTNWVSGATDSAFIIHPNNEVPLIKSTRSASPLSSTFINDKNRKGIRFTPPYGLFLSSNPYSNEINTPPKGKNTGPKNESTSRNEFSRTIRVSKWFSSMGGSGSTTVRSGSTKSVNLNISATESERLALATRFRLSTITSLSADLVVQPAFGVDGGGGRNEDNCCIEARGKVSARVKQTCVRTNEDFDVDLEFNFDATLKAMAATNVAGASMSEGEVEALNAAALLDDRAGRSKKKKGGKKQSEKRPKGIKVGQSTDIDALGMDQLQNILMDYEVTSDVIEDESCFCTDGIVDVGEIVSQMFRSKLDPYPKKPGSNPVKYTFTF